MVWDDAYPDGSVIAANQLHVVLQNMKVLLRERGICNNGSKDEHSWFGSTATGYHPLSEVGWCKFHTLLSDLEAFTPKVEGSLHYVEEVAVLYTIDSDADIVPLSTSHHGALTGLDEDDHTQYYRKDNDREFIDSVHLDSPAALTQTAPKSNDGSAMPSSHASQNWAAAHPAPNAAIVARHLADSCASYAAFGVQTPQWSTLDTDGSVALQPTSGTHHWLPHVKIDNDAWGEKVIFLHYTSYGKFGVITSRTPAMTDVRMKENS